MAEAALPGSAGFTSGSSTPAGVASASRQLQRGLLRTVAFVAAFCAVPGVASLLS